MEPLCGFPGQSTHDKYRSIKPAVATHVSLVVPRALAPANNGRLHHIISVSLERVSSRIRHAACEIRHHGSAYGVTHPSLTNHCRRLSTQRKHSTVYFHIRVYRGRP